MKDQRRHFVIATAIVSMGLVVGFWWGGETLRAKRAIDPRYASLSHFTLADLAKFNGTASGTPIYIGFDGYVYDVSAGAKFYGIGGTYHSIAGTDATAALHIFGGSIIREKYPVIGVLDVQ